MARKGYLHMRDCPEAWALLQARVVLPEPLPSEKIATSAAAGRISARATHAAVSSPAYHGAAMDGFVVRSADTLAATEARPVRLRRGQDALPIDTGDPIPAGFDAVLKIEDVHEPDGDTVELIAAAPPWQHVRLTGEDVVCGELVVPQGKRLSAYDVGALLAAGVVRVQVRRRPRVALLATGDELIEPGATPGPGEVVEFNTRILAALITEWGGEPHRLAPVKDDPLLLTDAVRAALADHDIVVVNAGSSAGRDDYTPDILAQVGELLVHGLNVMPGKPTAIAVTPSGRPILGLPGYPVSAAVVAERLLRPLLALFLGTAPVERERLRVRVARKVPSKMGHEEVLRVQVGRVEGGWVAAPLPRGAGVITSLSRANALMTIPALAEGFDAGQEVDVELLVPRGEAELTLVHVGSHDLALDVAGDLLRGRHPGRSLASANVGSLGGLYALLRGECHLAGTHLLDAETGEYNVPYVRRVFPQGGVVLCTLVHREQGFTVGRGNPKGITAIEDLARLGVRFVNRQRGAGTRVLFDARLAEKGLFAEAILGYDHEEYTHMAAAVAVASGIADCALTIRAAAAALGLDFIPLEQERYDLAIKKAELDRTHIQAFLETITSSAFRRAAEALPGYDATHAGTIAQEIE